MDDLPKTGLTGAAAHRKVQYRPPESAAIRAYARKVCEILADRRNDPSFLQPHVVKGLADFIAVAAKVKAKHLNAQQLVDDNEK